MPQFGVSVPANQISDLQTGATVRCHQRAAVTTTAGKLESFIAGLTGVPTFKAHNGDTVAPQYVQLSVEAGQTPGQVYVTYDGGSSPEVSATNGMLVPTQPAMMTIPAADTINSRGLGGGIRVVAITNTTNVQVFYGF